MELLVVDVVANWSKGLVELSSVNGLAGVVLELSVVNGLEFEFSANGLSRSFTVLGVVDLVIFELELNNRYVVAPESARISKSKTRKTTRKL